MAASARILIIEDDAAIRRGVRDALRHAGYEPHEAADGRMGLEQLRVHACDLVLLDMILPDIDGMEVLQSLRQTSPALPVIFLTACGTEPQRVAGLRHGADDYVVKPFSVVELLARIEAVLRRSAPGANSHQPFSVGPLELDLPGLRLRDVATGCEVTLSQRECDLLSFFVSAVGQTVSRQQLLRGVWQLDPRGIQTRTVDVHVARVREKLSGLTESIEIQTVHGRGYKLLIHGISGTAAR